MNRTRCPWCGKIIDRSKDKIFWSDVIESRATPRMLRQANCSHCRHKYGQVPIMRHIIWIVFLVLLIVVLAFIFQSAFLLIASVLPLLLLSLTPYSKLNEKGALCDENTDLLCEITIVENYCKISCNDLFFLDNDFDSFEPFIPASPICVYDISKKGNTIYGEFLYMNEKNYDYMAQESCLLYDTEMNLVAKIKFVQSEQEILLS